MSSRDFEDQQLSERRGALAAAAARYLRGEATLTETARDVTKWAHLLGIEFDEPCLTFLGIDSELDTFPVGEPRQHWRREALVREDSAREAAEARYADAAQHAASQILAMYGSQAAV